MLTNKNITLKFNHGFQWFCNSTIALKGYFYIDDVFYEKENALAFLTSQLPNENSKSFLKTLNGVFTIIISSENSVEIVCDNTRAFPLFYTIQNDSLSISDDILILKNKFKINTFDAIAKLEFKASNHTHSNETLLDSVFQLEPSTYLRFKNQRLVQKVVLFSYAIKTESKASYTDLKDEAIVIFEKAFIRLIKSLQNKTVLLPLSGGYDSRLIAVLLKKHNYKNVICFTYGRKENFEIENSKKTAEALGYPWYFIEYTPALISNYLETKEFLSYAHFAGKHSSMPYLQEYFAIKYLKEELKIPKNSVFIPGFAGDFLGGSEYNKIPKKIKSHTIADAILNLKLNNTHLSEQEKTALKHEINSSLNKVDQDYHSKIASTVFEDYNFRERLAKYIFNSASYYLFFDFEFRFPYWDMELLAFFKKVPITYKQMKILYDDVLTTAYFNDYNVNFKNEIQPKKSDLIKQKIKDKIKPRLSDTLKESILKKHDWNNYEPITKQMLLQMKKYGLPVKRVYKDYNEIISQWYIYLCENKLNN